MNGPQVREQHAPAEMAAHAYQVAEADAVMAQMVDGGEHEAEVMASHPGRPTPAEAVANETTPPSTGLGGPGAPGS